MCHLCFFPVRSFGTEDRCKDKVIPPRKEIYEYIVFRGQDIKDLNVFEPPDKQPAQQPQQDPAILHVSCCVNLFFVSKSPLSTP